MFGIPHCGVDAIEDARESDPSLKCASSRSRCRLQQFLLRDAATRRRRGRRGRLLLRVG